MSLSRLLGLATLLLALEGAGASEREEALARAQALARAGDHAAAAALYRAQLAKAPRDGEAALGLAQVTAWAGDHAGALAQLDALLAREPDNADALLLRARVLLWIGRPDEGLRTLAQRGGTDAEAEALREQLQRARGEHARWALHLGYGPERSSFTGMGHGAGLLLSYGRPGAWSVRAGAGGLHRFGLTDVGARVGASVRVTRALTLSADAELAPGARVLPRQAYGLQLLHGPLGRLTPSVGYRFADYQEADVHTLAPALDIALSRRADVSVRYALGLTRLRAQGVLTHSGLARVNLALAEPLRTWVGYARSEERFESGNPLLSPGGFRAHHLLGGVGLRLRRRTELELGLDQAWRSTGARVTTGSLGLLQRW